MSLMPVTNGEVVSSPAEQRVLDKIRQLPAEADQHLQEFLGFLEARTASQTEKDPVATAYALSLIDKDVFLRTMRQMPPTLAQLAIEYVFFLACGAVKWSYDDPVSLDRATELMAYDPLTHREIEAISREFSVCDNDGLEDY